MNTLFEAIAISVLMAVSVAAALWYFRMRRRMIKFMKDFTEELERELRPRDKEYTLLGYLVGYKAVYELGEGRRAYVLLTTTPRYSFFYYPVAKALRHDDRVTIMLELTGRNVLRDLHAVKRGESRLMNTLAKDLGERLERLSKTTVSTARGIYEVFYEEPKDVGLLNRIVDTTSKPIYKLSAYKELNAVEVVSKPELGSVRELLESLRFLIRNISRSVGPHHEKV
ncbi:MAG: hypothetical protein QXX81_06935 [Zestosphaera sp.]